jgi:FMN phosphatase YigB (HAD superfamily)
MDILLPQYFQLLSARMAHLLPEERFIRCLLRATQAMIDNDGRATNAEVFADTFYPRLGCPREVVEPILADFYARDFPTLRRCATCKSAARSVVQHAFDRGCDVVIATNPLFPATAIEQRLAWAEIADFPYRLVTTYENSRASKPNLRYYQHILDALGYSAAECLVVGDEAWDMVAIHLGCPTFLVPSHATKDDVEQYVPTYRGSLDEVIRVISNQ